ncbi:MAG: hypothetical protein A2086_05770 [Spirochaetes bacterium GWD1_27_9]|nr:MAG: hypothetical protein A2Z98_05995 [Spirochaetes bacterium GWB1_27_13]OHD20271.1 MAG: hypothetical protein A2Y34_15085 [Spirochaetes bacterium GWC1_27_15]OHD35285.1 MAG: hypothetical protein A2086_05770 [Spirochaetes bacterium GWD1_27_9]
MSEGLILVTDVKKIIIISILLFMLSSLFYADETNDSKKNFLFSFYYKQSQTYDFNQTQTENLFLLNEVNLNFSFPYKIWTISCLIDDIFVVDFYPLVYYDYFTGMDLLRNIFSINLNNEIHFRNAIKMFFDFGIDLDTPFYDYPSISFNPSVKFEGNYYYGFFWSFEQIVPINYNPYQSLINITSLNTIKIGYEFFRTFGPRKFKFSLVTENDMDIDIYDNYNQKILKNNLKNGIGLNFYGVSIYTNFVNLFYYGYENNTLFNNYIGFNGLINYSIKYLELSLNYTGMYDLTNPNNGFINQFEFYIKIRFNRSKTF